MSPLYLTLIAAEWGLVYFVWKNAIAARTTFLEYVGGRWQSWRQVGADVAIAGTAWLAWEGLGLLWTRGSAPASSRTVHAMLPSTTLEIALWIVLSVSAGIAEELVFRGYLQRKFASGTGNTSAAIVLQAVAFGAVHVYQGLEASLRITVYGVLCGCIAAWRKSLRPGMILHTWTDLVAGLVAR
jgi:membrane protease YdiL (CAAX protease family)